MLLQLGPHTIDCTNRTVVMGILNVSYDSPISESIVRPGQALERALELREAGAEIIDVGAHSTRTGGRDLTAQEEVDRVCPAIEAIAAAGIPVSVDTWTPAVANEAARAGVHLLNDVTGFTNPAMVDVAVRCRLPVVAMHMRGAPKHHREADQTYDNIAHDVEVFLTRQANALESAGVAGVWLDPGFGFGKSAADNLRLLNALPRMTSVGRPVLVSASRKGFLAELLGAGDRQDVEGLIEATIAFNVLAAWSGVHVVRVHDVREVVRAIRVVNAARSRLMERE
ncbi:MAG: dihydropteroate synthase [Dehalococcoidia bacterium]|nr:dihydropteroate synthase [Dehalococcoidia bacterium]